MLCRMGAIMSRKTIYTTVSILCLTISFFWPVLNKRITAPASYLKKEATLSPSKVVPVKVGQVTRTPSKLAKPSKPEPIKTVTVRDSTVRKVVLTKVPFSQLPGWNTADVNKSLTAFQNSCKTFLKQKPTHRVGNQHIDVRAGDWHPACEAALSIDSFTKENAKAFFEKWFHPIKFEAKKPIHGLFTGYYMPKLQGSLTKTAKFNTPIYGVPNKTRNHLPTRAQIDKGALKGAAPVIAWINSPVDRLSLEIEGSGVIQLPSGKNLYVGYAGENGAPYTSVGKVLINKSVFTKHTASQKAIKRYLKENPSKAQAILQRNKSFVFFENLKQPAAVGVKGIALTPGYSLAVDRKWIPIGAPLWLTTKKPDEQEEINKKFQRLMIAQDVGGAIHGLMRGDIYWGASKKASYLGEHMKNEGRYWLLLPKRTINRIVT